MQSVYFHSSFTTLQLAWNLIFSLLDQISIAKLLGHFMSSHSIILLQIYPLKVPVYVSRLIFLNRSAGERNLLNQTKRVTDTITDGSNPAEKKRTGPLDVLCRSVSTEIAVIFVKPSTVYNDWGIKVHVWSDHRLCTPGAKPLCEMKEFNSRFSK